MINMKDIMETVQMIEEEHLDIRTITMGISLLSCCDPDIDLRGRSGKIRPDFGPGGKGSGGQLYRRLFGFGTQRICRRG